MIYFKASFRPRKTYKKYSRQAAQFRMEHLLNKILDIYFTYTILLSYSVRKSTFLSKDKIYIIL